MLCVGEWSCVVLTNASCGSRATLPVGKDELIQHALQGIRGCLQGDQELTAASITVAVVGVDQPFKIIEGDELQPYVRLVLSRSLPSLLTCLKRNSLTSFLFMSLLLQIDAVEVSDVKDEDGDTKMSD